MWTFDYTAHRAFVAPAAEKSQIWRLFLGQILIIGVFVGAGSLIYLFIFEGLSLLNVDIDVANILSLLFSFGAVTAGVFTTVFLCTVVVLILCLGLFEEHRAISCWYLLVFAFF